MKPLSRFAAAFATCALAACAAGTDPGQPLGEPDDVNDLAAPLELDQIFEDAAAEFDVPEPLLAAIGYAETRWQMVEGTEEFDGVPAAFGVMALRGEQLAHGASLAGVSADEARHDASANVRAAAALLSERADALGLDRSDLAAWAPAVAALAALPDEESTYAYVAGEVYRAINEGTVLELEGGHTVARIRQEDVTPALPVPPNAALAGPDYPGSVWRPSPNYGARPAGSAGKIAMVVIHTCEGAYAGCWSYLRTSAAQASAHYVVKENGSEITQLVRESARAWHVAASYKCALNGNSDCGRNGTSVNNFSVGIEHGGFASQASFPNGQLEASARLTCNILKDHGVPRDRHHIVAHGQLQPYNRTDPGPHWPWTHYVDRVRDFCGDNGGGTTPPPAPPAGGTIIIDSNNANNDAARAKIAVSSTWASSSGTPGYYGSGYYWASTEAVSDGATFWFYLPAAATRSVDAWWVAGSNRSAAAPFVVFDAAGAKLGSVSKDQRASGSQWVALGSFAFTAGWNKVVLSRWTSGAGVVVADAVRIR